MLRSIGKLLYSSLQIPAQQQAAAASSIASARGFRAVVDQEIDFNNRETLKKYVGVRDHLSKEPGTKGRFIEAIRELLEEIKVLPDKSEYRKAVEATCAYRLQVCDQNESDAAVEEVLDSHLEELIKECREELRLIPIMAGNKPWDVPEDYTVPVVDYHDAAQFLEPKK